MDNISQETINLIDLKTPSVFEFKLIIKDITSNPNVMALKEHIQHASNSRFYHCLCVSYYTYAICKKLNLDYVSAARGAMLHDFYFYDWRNKHVEGQKKFHAYRHPRIALNNAKDIFELNDIQKDIILKHMWPLTLPLPRYRESFIVTLVDKYCATAEIFKSIKKRIKIFFKILKLLKIVIYVKYLNSFKINN